MRIAIVTPAAAGTRLGNRRTAQRWARILRALGHRVDVVTEWSGGRHDLMIALHAKKSLAAQLAFKRDLPARPLLLALTGTDVYRDVREDANAAAALERADQLIVLQDAALDELAPAQRLKARVVLQSEVARGPWQPLRRVTRFCVVGHLRAEKDPLLAAQALRRLDDPSLRLVQAGAALAPEFADAAQSLMRADQRYRWCGDLPHGRALALMRRSHAMIVSSILEGGAHVVSEAIVHGVPVLASDIPGNRGLLGAGYPGYFRVGDDAALASLMEAAAQDGAFLGGLAQALAERRPLFAPQREADAWRDLLQDVCADGCTRRRAPALP